MKFVKNNKQTVDIWAGMQIQPNTYYQLEELEYNKWANNSKVLTDITSGDLLVAKSNDGTTDISDIAEAINYLKDIDVKVIKQEPFASKTVGGKSLYKRVHGVVLECSGGSNIFDFDIPYTQAKITAIEIEWAPEECTADFFVLDDDTGTYSTIPNYPLNQFAFGAGISKDSYAHHSTYDADLYYGMTVSAVLYCPTGTSKKICVNFVLDEVKS